MTNMPFATSIHVAVDFLCAQNISTHGACGLAMHGTAASLSRSHARARTRLRTCEDAELGVDRLDPHGHYIGSIDWLYPRPRRRHVYCAGMDELVPKMTASPGRPHPRNGLAVGNAEMTTRARTHARACTHTSAYM